MIETLTDRQILQVTKIKDPHSFALKILAKSREGDITKSAWSFPGNR